MKIFIRTVAILLIIFATIKTGVNAQCGARTLALAQDNFDIGLFDRVIASLQGCIESGSFTNANLRIDAYRIMSNTYIAKDELEQAREYIRLILALNPNFDPRVDDSYVFKRLVAEMKGVASVYQITSVSKRTEDIHKTPATVMVVTRQEIEDAGYVDLEAVFNDLPGFDIARTYGSTYSNIYPRGYRSNNTDRILFMINGIEENDFWGNFVYWSRQIPITNVDRIEVIYGPITPMYGANAITGVNVLTKAPEKMVGDSNIGVEADIGYGTYNSYFADLSITARLKEDMYLSLTGRAFVSDERDLSSFAEYDFNPDDFDDIDYKPIMSVTEGANQYAIDNNLPETHPYYTLFRNPGTNEVDSIVLSDTGEAVARQFDKDALTDVVLNDEPLGYSNHFENYYIRGILKIKEFTLGYQSWLLRQGDSNNGTDNSLAGSKNGNIWEPQQTALFANYEKEIIPYKLYLHNILQFRTTGIHDQSRIVSLLDYSNSRLDLANLVSDSASNWITEYFFQHSEQIRNEFRLIYNPAKNVELVGGFELRDAAIQGDFYVTTNPDSSASEVGISSLDSFPGGNNFHQTNIGAFFQVAYNVKDVVKLFAGGRYDYEKVRATGGFGSVFDPRFAIIVTPGDFFLKAVFSSAFEDASNRDKYSIQRPSRLLNNPNLRPERTENFDIGIGYAPSPNLHIEGTYFNAHYTGVLTEVPVVLPNGQTTAQIQSVGKKKIWGIQAHFRYNFLRKYRVYGNYTYVDPHQAKLDESGQPTDVYKRVGDISINSFNVGFNGLFLQDKLNVNMRLNFVGERRTGQGTTVEANPQPGGAFPRHFILSGAVTVRELVPGLRIQLTANNILDQEYAHPGIKIANGVTQAFETPQRRLNFMG
ncbi:MAG: TonB-dependent receptor, partial [Bacteroidota bacterium]